MNKKSYLTIIVLLFVLFFGIVIYEEKHHSVQQSVDVPANTDQVSVTPLYSDLIQIDTPKQGSLVSSPISVSGKARGPWYFEASAPIEVTDANGKVIGTSYITAQGEWMTTEFVPFSGTITLSSTPTTPIGFVVFRNDNASGDPKTEKMVKVQVVFK